MPGRDAKHVAVKTVSHHDRGWLGRPLLRWITSDIWDRVEPVRFTPESGHVRCTSLCLLWAKSGHTRNSFGTSESPSGCIGTGVYLREAHRASPAYRSPPRSRGGPAPVVLRSAPRSRAPGSGRAERSGAAPIGRRSAPRSRAPGSGRAERSGAAPVGPRSVPRSRAPGSGAPPVVARSRVRSSRSVAVPTAARGGVSPNLPGAFGARAVGAGMLDAGRIVWFVCRTVVWRAI